jgi:hypothetical protein
LHPGGISNPGFSVLEADAMTARYATPLGLLLQIALPSVKSPTLLIIHISKFQPLCKTVKTIKTVSATIYQI